MEHFVLGNASWKPFLQFRLMSISHEKAFDHVLSLQRYFNLRDELNPCSETHSKSIK